MEVAPANNKTNDSMGPEYEATIMKPKSAACVMRPAGLNTGSETISCSCGSDQQPKDWIRRRRFDNIGVQGRIAIR